MPKLSERLQQYREDFGARQAARMRLPAWLGFLMPLMALSSIFSLTAVFIEILWSLHRVLHPGISFGEISGGAHALIFFPAFFGALAPALMLLNLILARIAPLRRIFDENSKGVPGAAYAQSMKGLRKAAMILVPPSAALGLIGATEPWAF